METSRKSGWDAAAIARIAKEKYGGMRQMFEHHGWPERGSAMMPAQQRRVADEYGDVATFMKKHGYDD